MSRTTVPPIVLPITSRGVAVTDRLCWGFLGVAMVIAAALILYLSRGTTFYTDEVVWLSQSPSLSASDLVEPDNGHLIVTTRLIYKLVLETFGADYVAFRVLNVLALLLSVGLFYALARRRIGALPALVPALVLLFLGSAWRHFVIAIGITPFLSIAAGLGALLALEREDRRGDIAACGLISLSAATFSIGLAFLVGVATSVVIRSDRVRRAGVFLVPLSLYVIWWLWALQAPESSQSGHTTLSNVLLIPGYTADALAGATGALTGLDYQFGAAGSGQWGPIVGTLAVVALAARIMQGKVPASLWASLGIMLTYWALGALAFGSETRSPSAIRYVYPGVVAVLLVATDAARSVRFSGLGLAALFAAAALSIATNVALLRDGAAWFRNERSSAARAQFAMLELGRGRIDRDFDVRDARPEVAVIPVPAGSYFAALDSYGSPAYSLTELERQSESVRQGADQILASALELRLKATRPGARRRGCEDVRSEPLSGGTAFELPSGGATVRARGAGPAEVTVGRFGTPSVQVGTLSPGETARLTIPPDSSPRPWRAFAAGARDITVCSLR